jgi:hypothetical protein
MIENASVKKLTRGFRDFEIRPFLNVMVSQTLPDKTGEKQKEGIMKKTISLAVCALFVAVMISGIAFSADKKAATPSMAQEIMITGMVNNANQVVAKDGQTFQIADTKEGMELSSYVGMKVQVKGTVMEKEGKKQITVSNYEVIKK